MENDCLGCWTTIKKKTAALFTLLVISAPMLLIPQTAEATDSTSIPSGPSVDELVFRVTKANERETDLIADGVIDMIPSITYSMGSNLTSVPSVKVLRSTTDGGQVACVFFNCRRAPCNDTGFRAAVSQLVNREYLCDTLLGGDADPIRTFIPPIAEKWTNSEALAPDFDSVKAMQALDMVGYKLDSTSGWRINPETKSPLHQLTVVTPLRSEDPTLWVIGYTLCYYMNATGIPVKQVALSGYQLTQRTMLSRDFDICVLNTSLSWAPFGLYTLLHSSQDTYWTKAYSGVKDGELDGYLETLFNSISEPEAVKAALAAQTRVSELLPYVPVLSKPMLSAIRGSWADWVNIRGTGLDNLWTMLGTHESGARYGGKLTLPTRSFLTLNPCVANSSDEWSVLRLIYSPLFTYDPETLDLVPVLAESWSTEPWALPSGGAGMKVTFTLAKNAVWQDGVPFTSGDIKFCVNYLKSNNITYFESATNLVEKLETPNDHTIIFYLNEPGFRLIYSLAWFTFLPEHIWGNVTDYQHFRPWEADHPTTPGLTELVGNGPFILLKSKLDNEVHLGWNPSYLYSDPAKPSLTLRTSTGKVAVVGDPLDVKYTVANLTSKPLLGEYANFKIRITDKNGATVQELPVKSVDGFIQARIDTKNMAAGNYTCTLIALPYGSDSFTMSVESKPAGVPGYSALAMIVGFITALILLALRARLRENTERPYARMQRSKSASDELPTRSWASAASCHLTPPSEAAY